MAIFSCFQVVFMTVKGWFQSWSLRSITRYFEEPLDWFFMKDEESFRLAFVVKMMMSR